MVNQDELIELEEPFSLSERRAFMRLPIEERRKRLLAQAARSAEHYEQEQVQQERMEWQGGDIVEY
jgi:hypothetical protein